MVWYGDVIQLLSFGQTSAQFQGPPFFGCPKKIALTALNRYLSNEHICCDKTAGLELYKQRFGRDLTNVPINPINPYIIYDWIFLVVQLLSGKSGL